MARKTFDNIKLKSKLIFTYLIIGIVPFVAISLLMLNYFTKNLEQQAFNQLLSLRDIKKSQLTEYFEQVKNQTQYFVGSIDKENMNTTNTRVLQYLIDFREDIKPLATNNQNAYTILQKLYVTGSEDEPTDIQLNRDYYDYTHEEIHPFLKTFVNQFHFDNLYLVTSSGNIVYSVFKETSFGTNLINGKYASSSLGQAFIQVKNAVTNNSAMSHSVFFSDFDQINSNISAFISMPLYEYGKFQGVIIFQLPFSHINNIMSTRSGLGETGETYLVGSDQLMRSEGYRAPRQYSIKSTLDNPASPPIATLPVQTALKGEANILVTTSYLEDEVLSAYTPIDVFGYRWALIAEVSTNEAFATINQLQLLAVFIALVIIIAIIFIGYTIASTIAKPILTLTDAAEKIAAGNLQQAIDIQRQDEIGRLAHSFAIMRTAVADKIHEIEQQNIALKKLDEFKNNLLANTTHELKTPLNGIIGLTESLVGQIPQRYTKTLHNIINSGRRLSNLVNDILDAAKLKQKQIQLKAQPLNLRQIVDLDISISASLIGDKPVNLVNLVPDSICVQADQHRLQQILQNLIGNAIKFTDRGEIQILAQPRQHVIEVSVIDTGIGININDQQRIFDAFEQSESGANRSYSGTGLGLAITKHLVELHGGSIRVDSTPTKGSSFIFTLPISHESPKFQETALEPTVEFSQVLEPPQLNQGKEKDFVILAVDDEPINLDIILNHLANSSCQVVPAYSGKEALHNVKKNKPDLILLDVMMPQMDGYEVCNILREQYTSYDLPIIFLTARNQLSDLIYGFNVGGNDYLTKPFFKDELLARIKVQLELLIHRKRMKQLHQFSNNISQFKSHEEMVQATYELLVSDPLIEAAVTFFEGKVTSNTPSATGQLTQYPPSLDKEIELTEINSHLVSMYIKVSNFYALAATFPKSSSEEWLRTIVLQAHKSIEQIRRISSSPDNAIIHKHIVPCLKDILYIKVEKNYCILVKYNGQRVTEEILRIPFKQVLFYIEKDHLFQVHRSYAINPNKIQSISNNKLTIYLENDLEVPIAKKYLPDLKSHYPEKFTGAVLMT
ncbi:ATP-binding protein [Spartinivicinus poritis]|uniref:histidine kinase n=1 Tax=Spartinivicinus poritis TaxID=2994640 RepID=A0ABT5U7S3_9GAMM|nr:ATP-binding protein [Spartinivicinus sp. A2-2]MDE1462046.1 ATP-binding protein [Spartinivicinus sp. A2-2]